MVNTDWGDFFTFQQDNALAHRARWHRGVFSRNTPDFISPLLWPPSSPDLNPVDYEGGVCFSNASTVKGFATSTTWNSVSSRSGVASTRTSLTEQFDSSVFDYARVSVQTAATLSTNCNWCFVYELLRRLYHIGNFCFWVPFLKQLLLRNCAVNFVEICNIYFGKMIIKVTKRIFNSNKICRSYSDLNFGVTFLEHSVIPACTWSKPAVHIFVSRSVLFLQCFDTVGWVI